MHLLDAIIHELHSLNMEQKWRVHDITDRSIKLYEALAFSQTSNDNKEADFGNKQREKKDATKD